jgi:hypothetical protein
VVLLTQLKIPRKTFLRDLTAGLVMSIIDDCFLQQDSLEIKSFIPVQPQGNN